MARVNRETRLSAARDIIRDNPRLSKEVINTRLKETYGVGLRYSVILSEKREITKAPRREEAPQPRYTPPARERERERPSAERQRATPIAPTRERRIAVAREIIRKEPSLRKEEISDRLKMLFGVGLRHSVILKEKRVIFKDSPKLMPEKNLNRRYFKAVFGSLQEQRFDKLLHSKVWSAKEAQSLSQLPLSRLQYLADMEKSRHNLISQMQIARKVSGWTKAEYQAQLQAAIEAEYKQRGWTTKAGTNEIFRMVDDFRQSMIDEGKNPSPGGGKGVYRNPDGSIRFRRPKGDTAAQKARYRELHPDSIREQRQRYNIRLAARRR